MTRNGQHSKGHIGERETLPVEDQADSALLEALREATLRLPDTQLTHTPQRPSRDSATARPVKYSTSGQEGVVKDLTGLCVAQDQHLVRNDPQFEGYAETMVVSLPITYYRNTLKTVKKCVGETPVITVVNEAPTGDGVADILTAAEDVGECGGEVGECGGEMGECGGEVGGCGGEVGGCGGEVGECGGVERVRASERPHLSPQSSVYLSPCIPQQTTTQRTEREVHSLTSVVSSSQFSQETARHCPLPGLTARDHSMTTRDHSPPDPTTTDHSPPHPTTRDHSTPSSTTRDHSPPQEISPAAGVSAVPDSLCPPSDHGYHPVITPSNSTHSESPAHNTSSDTSSSQGLTLSTQDLELLQLRIQEKRFEAELEVAEGEGKRGRGEEREGESAGDLESEVFIIPESVPHPTHLPTATNNTLRKKDGENVIDLTDGSTVLPHTPRNPQTHHQKSRGKDTCTQNSHMASNHKTKPNFCRRNVKCRESPPPVQMPRLPDNHPFLSISTSPSLRPQNGAIREMIRNKFQNSSSNPLEDKEFDTSTTSDVKKQQKLLPSTTDSAPNPPPPSFLASSLSRNELVGTRPLFK